MVGENMQDICGCYSHIKFPLCIFRNHLELFIPTERLCALTLLFETGESQRRTYYDMRLLYALQLN